MAAYSSPWRAMAGNDRACCPKATWTQLLLSVGIACCKERQSKARKKKPDQKIWAGEVLGLWLAVVVGSANSEQRAGWRE